MSMHTAPRGGQKSKLKIRGFGIKPIYYILITMFQPKKLDIVGFGAQNISICNGGFYPFAQINGIFLCKTLIFRWASQAYSFRLL